MYDFGCKLLLTQIMLCYLLLLVCLWTSPIVSADTECYEPYLPVPAWRYPGPAPTADCLAIIDQFPSLVADEDPVDGDADPVRLHPANSPFFPQATFGHGGCVARISYHSGPQPTNTVRARIIVEERQQEPFTSGRSLSEASIFEIWTAARAAAQSITDECTSNHFNGVSWTSVEIPEMTDVWCAVHILGYNTRGWEHRARIKGWNALRGYRRSQRGTAVSSGNEFKTAIVDVL